MKKYLKKTAYLAILVLMGFSSGCVNMYGDFKPNADAEWPWTSVTPESQGMTSENLNRMVKYIEDNNLDIDSVLIYRNGTIPFEKYFGRYNKHVSHNIKSTSKGIISALVGIALEQGYIGSLDEKVLSYFPEYQKKFHDKTHITIRDLLTMSSGLGWEENGLNSMYTFFVSKKIVPRVLDLPVAAEPGEVFNYNTGLTHLLSAVITKASGMTTLEFADQYLFRPLGIGNIQWTQDRHSYYIGGSELYLTPRAMMKFGVLYLDKGVYQGKQIVPPEWVEESTETQMTGSFHGAQVEYGYLWWRRIGHNLFSYLENENAFMAMGSHGQRIFIHPDLDTVVVITADQEDESQCDILLRDFILPAL